LPEFPPRRFIPHNGFMPLREISGLMVASLTLCLTLWLSPLASEARPAAGLDAGYVRALAAADHFLQAWQSGDLENGTALLTSHAKEAATTEGVERFFSNPGPSAYEIVRGKLVKRGRYEFPVALITGASKNSRRRFFSIVVVNTGDNDWAVDTLP
jgi:hypothetical protein